MTYILIVSLIVTLILQCIFSNFMKKKYKITSSEFRDIKFKTLGVPIWLFIVLFIALYLIIAFEYNTISIVIALISIACDFIYGLKKIKKLNEKKYTIYYIGESTISILLIILLIINMFFK